MVKLRDGGCVACLLAGRAALGVEAHHIIFQAQGNWRIQYDPDFGLTLCPWHHRHSPEAPHVSPLRFEAEVLPHAIQLMDSPRHEKLLACVSDPSPPAEGYPDFKAIRKRLRARIVELENDYYCDADIERQAVGYRPSAFNDGC